MSASEFVWAGAAAASAAAASLWLFVRRRPSPERREALRRQRVHRRGRICDAVVTDISDSHIYYEYELSGVEYSASQDVSALLDSLPAEWDRALGPAAIKYLPENPANSIVIMEEWNGLRQANWRL